MRYRLINVRGREPPYTPFPFQAEFLDAWQRHSYERPARAMAVWPRRHGKDLTALHGLLEMAHDRVGMYWHGLPVYEQARKAVWTAFRTDTGQRLMDNVFPKEVVRRPTEWAPNGEMTVELRNGSIINFVGSDSVDHLVGAGLAGLTCSEFGLWRPTAYDLLRPILREAHAWATFIFTPRGHNHAWKLYQKAKTNPRWFLSHKTIYDAGRYTKAEADAILAEEREEGMLEELIQQEYLTDFTAANVGSYWGNLLAELERRGALADFEHERDGIWAAFDLGISDSTAIWAFRVTDDGADFVAHYEASSQPLSHYFDKLEEWEKKLGFRYAGVILPHDAKARTVQTGLSVYDQFLARYGAGRLHLIPPLDVLDGIQAVRRLLQQNVRFHPRCNERDGIEAIRQYHRTYDEARKVFLLHPEHDWSSHSADALRYAALSMDVIRGRQARAREKKLIVPAPKMTMDELWKTRKLRVGGRRA